MRLISLSLLCVLAAAAVSALSVSAGATAKRPPPARMPDQVALKVVRMAGDSLVARRRAMPSGGWAWRSSIQAPHYQTDRDVGAASIGEGLLAAYAVTGEVRYRRAAIAAGDFLLGVAEPAAGGLRWPDWADPDGRARRRTSRASTTAPPGSATTSGSCSRSRTSGASATARSPACAGWSPRPRASCPETACSWRWTDDPRLARRLPRSRHGPGGHRPRARRLRRPHRRTAPSALMHAPAPPGSGRSPRTAHVRCRAGPRAATLETGFLSGSAGRRYMFLERYRRDRDPADLATAHRLLRWVNEQAVADPSGGLRWPVAERRRVERRRASSSALRESPGSTFTPHGRRAGPTTARSHAARASGSDTSGSAGRLARAARRHESPVHVGLDSGAAGIGWVLADLAAAGIDADANRQAARSALDGLRADAARDRARRVLVRASDADSLDGSPPNPRGTGALRGSPPSRPGSAAGPGRPRRAARSLTRRPEPDRHRRPP